jgi:hypothetical protein
MKFFAWAKAEDEREHKLRSEIRRLRFEVCKANAA